MHISRRNLVGGGTLGATALLVGCNVTTPTTPTTGGGSTPPATPSIFDQGKTVLNNFTLSIAFVVPWLETQLPQYKADIESAYTVLTQGNTAIQGITETTAPNADTTTKKLVLDVESAINTVLSIASKVPLIPEPYSGIISAASVVAPEIEAKINTYILGTASALSPRAATYHTLQLEHAHTVLAQGAALYSIMHNK